MEFWRYYRIIRRRRWLILIGMVICVGGVALSNYMAKPLFTGRTTVMEPEGMSQQEVPLYPSQLTQLDVQLRLSNLASIATSQRVFGAAAETLPEYGMRFSPQQIFSSTKVSPVRDTNILAVEVTLPDPNEAMVAADVIAEEFKRVYSELNNAALAQSREFIEAQLETTREAMVKAQDERRKFKEANEIVMIDQQTSAVVQRMSQAKTDINNANTGLQAITARTAQLEKELAKMPEWETTGQTTSRNPIWQRLKEELLVLETRKAAMMGGTAGTQRRGPNHPDIAVIQGQIDEIKAKFVNEAIKEDYVAATQESVNTNYKSTLDRWLMSKVDQLGYQAQREALAAALEEMRGELAELPEKQAKLAELDADVYAATNTYSLMRNKLDEAKIKEKQARNEVALKTIDPAYVFPVNQRKMLKLLLALILSPLLGIGVAFLLHYTDNTIKTAADAEKLIGLPVLTAVPGARGHSLPRQKCSEAMEVSYQMLTSGLWIANQNQQVNSVAVVSAEPDVGRSVVASNLATSLAREGARVILVDADLRQPTQHLIFGVDNKVGLTNVLSGGAALEDAVAPTRVQGLLLVPTGPAPENPVKLLRSAEMNDFAQQVKDLADFVIYDTPAGVSFPDPVLVATQAGNAVLVHAAGRVPRGSEPEFRAKLEAVGVRLLGTVLNRVRREDSSGYFHYHRSYEGVRGGQLSDGKKAISN